MYVVRWRSMVVVDHGAVRGVMLWCGGGGGGVVRAIVCAHSYPVTHTSCQCQRVYAKLHITRVSETIV